MTEHFQDEDIEFDFFEDEVTTREEPAPVDGPREPRPARPGGRPPGRPAGHGLTARARLIGLIAFGVLVIVLLVFLIASCTGTSKKGKFEGYMQKIGAVGKDSTQIGRDLDTALTTPGIKPNELATKLDGLADQGQQVVTTAEAIDAPGSLRAEHAAVLEALRFRISGLRALADVFRSTAGSNDASGAALQLAVKARRLVAGDVVWADLFRTASLSEMRSQGVSGVVVPESDFVSNADFSSPRYWQPVFERVNGAATGSGTTAGGLHGTGIVEVKALPSNKVLSASQENIVTAGTDLGFAVTVQDTGDNQEVRVKVTLTIQQQPSPIVATQTIASINPGEQKVVIFRNLGQVQYVTRTTVKVDVQPVQGEANATNNSAEYSVIFSL